MAPGPKSQLLIDYDGHEGLRALLYKELLTRGGDLYRPLGSYHMDSRPEWA